VAAALTGGASRIENDDLSLEHNVALIQDREKWSAEKRADEPLMFGSHPGLLTFAADGPLRQISIQQMRLLKERAQFKPLNGRWTVFLVDGIDRANEQAANSLLKTLEEPPPHLIIIMTAENAYDLLPTVRSRSMMLPLTRLSDDEMAAFVQSRAFPDAQRRLRLASGSPGVAVRLDLAEYDKRRAGMLALLEAASSAKPFARWLKYGETLSATKSERLDANLKVLYLLLEDIVQIKFGSQAVLNEDVRKELSAIASHVSFEWLRAAVVRIDELLELSRRNIQKGIALDALVTGLQRIAG
jgi:DNA polymerase-3 subunit delta'